MRIVRGAGDNPGSDAEPDGSASSESDNSSTNSEDGNNSSNVVKTERTTPKISVVMPYIYDQVGLLYHLSVLLHPPALMGRYIKSAARDGKPSPFAQYDYSHIVEKFHHWQHIAAKPGLEDGTSSQQALAFNQDPEEDRAVSESDPCARLDVESAQESHALIQRLARANTRRREQLQYWTVHPSRS